MRASPLATLLLLGLSTTTTTTTSAFMTRAPSLTRTTTTTTAMAAANYNNNNNEAEPQQQENAFPTGRRGLLLRSVGVAVTAAMAATTSQTPPASATYSAYTRREQDWQERLDKGEVKVSSARDLRRQLREIAPMNDEGSKIFCPNGPSSAVSPLMENKCDDVRQAIPSVYGRTQDTVGNSIPGFAGGRYMTVGGGSSGNIAADIGGFPTYDPKTGRSER